MASPFSGPFPPASNPYWRPGPVQQPTYQGADRVLNWRNTPRVVLGSISTNLGGSSIGSEPFTQQSVELGSSASSSRGWTQLKPYHRPGSASAPTLARGEPAPPLLSNLPKPQLSNSSLLNHSIACSSCDALLPNLDDTQDPVQLLPCGHAICSTCLTLLVNSAANVPPRAVDCFLCGEAVETFAGVKFEDEVVVAEGGKERSGQVTPSKRTRPEDEFDQVEGSSLPRSSGGSHLDLANLNLADNSPSTASNNDQSGSK